MSVKMGTDVCVKSFRGKNADEKRVMIMTVKHLKTLQKEEHSHSYTFTTTVIISIGLAHAL